MGQYSQEINKRRTFAIISHPDAGKTTLTEKLLLYGGAINLAGSVKAKKTAKHAVSDWMEIEKERGISVIDTFEVFSGTDWPVDRTSSDAKNAFDFIKKFERVSGFSV